MKIHFNVTKGDPVCCNLSARKKIIAKLIKRARKLERNGCKVSIYIEE